MFAHLGFSADYTDGIQGVHSWAGGHFGQSQASCLSLFVGFITVALMVKTGQQLTKDFPKCCSVLWFVVVFWPSRLRSTLSPTTSVPGNDTDLLLLLFFNFSTDVCMHFFFSPAVKSFEDTMKIAKTQHKDRVVLLNFKGPLTRPQPAGSVKEAKDRRCALCKD